MNILKNVVYLFGTLVSFLKNILIYGYLVMSLQSVA